MGTQGFELGPVAQGRGVGIAWRPVRGGLPRRLRQYSYRRGSRRQVMPPASRLQVSNRIVCTLAPHLQVAREMQEEAVLSPAHHSPVTRRNHRAREGRAKEPRGAGSPQQPRPFLLRHRSESPLAKPSRNFLSLKHKTKRYSADVSPGFGSGGPVQVFRVWIFVGGTKERRKILRLWSVPTMWLATDMWKCAVGTCCRSNNCT